MAETRPILPKLPFGIGLSWAPDGSVKIHVAHLKGLRPEAAREVASILKDAAFLAEAAQELRDDRFSRQGE